MCVIENVLRNSSFGKNETINQKSIKTNSCCLAVATLTKRVQKAFSMLQAYLTQWLFCIV